MKWYEIPLVCGDCKKVAYRPFRAERRCFWCDGVLRCEVSP